MDGQTCFSFPKDKYCVSYSELIQRELLWLEIFFFQFCFLKIVKFFLRNPNPNLTLTPTLPRVIFGEKELCGSAFRDLSFTRRKLTICDDKNWAKNLIFDEQGVLNWAKALLITLSSIKNNF